MDDTQCTWLRQNAILRYSVLNTSLLRERDFARCVLGLSLALFALNTTVFKTKIKTDIGWSEIGLVSL